jgi:hypothetical protein
MKKQALWYALAYAALVIAFKLFIVLKGYSLSRFGFYYSSFVATLLIIPFYILAIKHVRDKQNGGVIGGREAMRVALTVFAVSAVIIGVYNYFEYEYSGRQLAIEYYHSDQFLEFLKKQKLAPEKYPSVIEEQVTAAQGAAFRSVTGKLFSALIIGLSSAFIVVSVMKRRPSQPLA